jgi:hypothetical protein
MKGQVSLSIYMEVDRITYSTCLFNSICTLKIVLVVNYRLCVAITARLRVAKVRNPTIR